MPVKTSFINDSKAHDATEWASYFRKFVTNGVFTDPADSLYVTNPNGLNLSVQPGAAFVDGVQVESTGELTLTLEPTPTSRVDRIVVRVDQAKPEGGVFIVKGTDGSLEPPSLANATSKKELCLSEVTLDANGVSSISDKRPTSLCGFVQNFLGKIDASGLFANWEAEFGKVLSEFEHESDLIESQAKQAFAGFYSGASSNAIINGGFDIDQRGGGTVHSLSSGQKYTLDRWIARVDGAIGSPAGFRRYKAANGQNVLRIDNQPMAGPGQVGIGQYIENGASMFGGKSFTVHFFARADQAQKVAVAAQVRHSATQVTSLPAQTFDIGTEWSQCSATFECQEGTTDESENVKVTVFTSWAGTDANNRFGTDSDNGKATVLYIRDFVACVGTLPMPFSRQHFADEMERCRRYFRKQGLTTLLAGTMKGDKTLKTQAVDFAGMRKAPTVTVADRIGSVGKASWELTTSGIEDGHTASTSSNSDGMSAVFVVQPLGASQVQAASIVFGSIEADAEITS